MITESNVKLNVSKLNVLKDIFAKQKDSNSRFLNCLFFDGDGRRFVPVTQGDVVINAERTDGSYRSFVGSINDDGSVRVPLTNWMLEKAGDLICSVTIYEGTEKLTTAAFQIFVEKAENPDGAISPDDPATDVAQQLVLRAEAAASDAETVLNEIDNKFDGAGITKTEYSPLFGGEFTVVTENQQGHEHPYKKASVTGRINKNYQYRVTIDGSEFILPSQLIDHLTQTGYKVVEYLGNIDLSDYDTSGLLNTHYDLDFLIVSDDDNLGGIEVYTESAGSHTILVERIEFTYQKMPNELIYGSNYYPIQTTRGSSTYECVSIGVNRFIGSNVRAAYAFGYSNSITANHGFARGIGNQVSGLVASADGYKNEASGVYSRTQGIQNIATGQGSFAHGAGCEADGRYSEASGFHTKATHKSQHVFGECNVPDDSNSSSDQRGNFVEIVGNGIDDDHPSNARTLDWSGNESLAGSITLGKGTADEVTLTAAQLKRLIALLS